MSGLRVDRLECQVLVEDLGRPGLAHLGVPSSGALDPAAVSMANRLVGNRDHHAVLEVLLGGVRLIAEGSTRLAVVGAQVPLLVDGRPAEWGAAVSVPDGSTVEIGRAVAGTRAWVAVGGGIDVPPVLGSRSTDTLTGLGPPAVRVGDLLATGRAGPRPAGPVAAVPWSSYPDPLTVTLHVGPRDDWFTPESMERLGTSVLKVSSRSDRIALLLNGPPLVRRIRGELPSEGIVTGAVQVPGDGMPLVFLADHPTTGGYPVVGVVGRPGLARCAQLRPGDRLRFELTRQPGAPTD